MMEYTVPTKNAVKRDLNFYILFWLFMIGNVLGFGIEGAWTMFKTGHWENHAATVWGPFCIIYGIGAVIVYVTSHFLKDKNILIKFGAFLLSGSLVEYFGGLFQEICFGSRSWDYSSHTLNIGGKVSLKMALIWGVFGLIFMYILYPFLKKVLSKCLSKPMKITACIVAVFMVINLFITSLAVLRWKARLDGINPGNTVDVMLDGTYNNEKMTELFVNMQFSNGGDNNRN